MMTAHHDGFLLASPRQAWLRQHDGHHSPTPRRQVSTPCDKTGDAKRAVKLFIDHVVRWSGLPDSIVSDRGPQFPSLFQRSAQNFAAS